MCVGGGGWVYLSFLFQSVFLNIQSVLEVLKLQLFPHSLSIQLSGGGHHSTHTQTVLALAYSGPSGLGMNYSTLQLGAVAGHFLE